MKYLVTGATGGYGAQALETLKNIVPISDIYALVRSEEKGKKLKNTGFNVRIGNYSDYDSMVSALKGIDRLLFVSGGSNDRQIEHKNVVDAAKKNGVSYIAYTSFPNASESTSFLAVDHIFTEKIISESEIAHTFLRNNWYLENEMPIIGHALSTGNFIYSAENGKAGWALKREYAEVGAKAIASGAFPEILELSGKLLTYEELAKALLDLTGKKLQIVSSDDQTFVDSMISAGLSNEVANMFLLFQKIVKDNQVNVYSDDFENALGRPTMDIKSALKELLRL
ncbi:SDR family oxidoreductase (plasmid) [Weissella hellenica]|nr:SDR family oxidoreductase [Weissella hellenica]